jgi:hypothetical protein
MMRGGGGKRQLVIHESDCGHGLKLVTVERGHTRHLILVNPQAEGGGVLNAFSLPNEASACEDFIYQLAQSRGLGIGS